MRPIITTKENPITKQRLKIIFVFFFITCFSFPIALAHFKYQASLKFDGRLCGAVHPLAVYNILKCENPEIFSKQISPIAYFTSPLEIHKTSLIVRFEIKPQYCGKKIDGWYAIDYICPFAPQPEGSK